MEWLTEMLKDIELVAILILTTIAVGLLWLQRRHSRRHMKVSAKLAAFQGEEERMFSFLHELGMAIGSETSVNVLSKMIVDGIGKVVNARGGAIYFVSADGKSMVPAYVSEDCPPLVGIPVEVKRKAERDPRAVESHLKLSKVVLDEGILGYCLTVGHPIWVRDVKYHPSFNDAFTRYTGDVSAMLAPLRHAGKDLGVVVAARLHTDRKFSENDFAIFRAVAEQSSFAIGNARVHGEVNEKRILEKELKNAREVQQVLLPQKEPDLLNYNISGTNVPARIISGDYYDYIPLGGDKLGVVIADVSGKGLPAGLMMAMCRSALRSVAQGRSSPSEVLGLVNRQLFPDMREDMFISMAYLILDAKSHTVVMARAGHDPALKYTHETGRVETLRSPGLALGVDGGSVFERVTKDMEFELKTGDCILLYTDGVKEALDKEEEEFGIERMSENFGMSAPLGSQIILERLQDELKRFTDHGVQMDDITLVAIERL